MCWQLAAAVGMVFVLSGSCRLSARDAAGCTFVVAAALLMLRGLHVEVQHANRQCAADLRCYYTFVVGACTAEQTVVLSEP